MNELIKKWINLFLNISTKRLGYTMQSVKNTFYIIIKFKNGSSKFSPFLSMFFLVFETNVQSNIVSIKGSYLL